MSGIGPLMLEYIDILTMAAMIDQLGLKLGVPDEIRGKALAYLVVVLESARADRLDEDVQAVGRAARGARRDGRLRAAAERRGAS